MAIGDIHGDLTRFKDILANTGLFDGDFNWIAPEGAVLVQMGDMVDRTPGGEKIDAAFHFLRDLQKKIGDYRIIRLLGNHELMVIQRHLYYYDGANPHAMRQLLINDIEKGLLRAATWNEWLFVHGGVSQGFLRSLRHVDEDSKSIELQIVKHCNVELLKAAQLDLFPETGIFACGYERSGDSPWSGPFWADYNHLADDDVTCRQIVGHTPHSHWTGCEVFNVPNIIDIDTGISRHYNGMPSYLVMHDPENIEFHCLKAGVWHTMKRRQEDVRMERQRFGT